jgi:membrane dipeptidase
MGAKFARRPMLIVDAHLDLAYNALRGREVLRPALEQTADEEGIPTVGIPDLRAGNVGLVCATVFCEPSIDGKPGYRNADEARAAALAQLAWYLQQEDAGVVRFLRSSADARGIEDSGSRIEDGGKRPSQSSILHPLSSILLLEGADPLRTPADVAEWFDAGLRIVGLAWKRTRYAGGTGAPGPLTPEGVRLVRELDRFGMIHDTSHLAEESFWQLLDVSPGPVMASHSNCRAIVPTDRQLSDDMIRALVRRDGVIGINFFDKFLVPPGEHKTRRATLADVVRHVRHMCDLAGDVRHVGIGTDMDGGLGREQIPREITTSADLPRVAEALSGAGFSDADVQSFMGGNWLRFFGEHLAGAK